MKRALVLGVGGMDGSHLADLLLEKGYEVHGLVRRSSYDNLARIAHVRDRVTVHRGDLADPAGLVQLIDLDEWNEIYNTADQDEVGWSKDVPGYSWPVTVGAVQTILEALRSYAPNGDGPRFFQPISSTVFGSAAGPCDEDSPLAPASPYACAKAAAWLLCKHYRREHGVFVSCGVFFNHTSPRQKGTYLLPTIARQAVEVARGKRDRVELTGPDNWIDVGWSPEYVDAAWRTLQQDSPDDYVVGTHNEERISTLCQLALEQVNAGRTSYVMSNPTKPGTAATSNTHKVRERLKWGGIGTKSSAQVLESMVRHFTEVV